MNMHILTKSKITSGLQCVKKLWFDVNDPIKKDLHIFYIGNRFGDFSRQHYGQGLNLDGQFDVEFVLNETKKALDDPNVNAIYEGAFLSDGVLIRADVLLRKGTAWEMIEVKSSTSQKPEHIADAAIQAFVIRSCGVDLNCIKIGHINKEFTYTAEDNYVGLLTEVDITTEVNNRIAQVSNWIDEMGAIVSKDSAEPMVQMSEQCNEPHVCPYQSRCESLLPKFEGVPINIIPRIGSKLAEEWRKKGIHDLRQLPESALKTPMQKMIQLAHTLNQPVINSALPSRIRAYGWPRYFMDFETVQQGVPLLLNTKPYDAIPFQWSVHRWDSSSHKPDIKEGDGFLKFLSPSLDRDFLTSLLEAVGVEGPIFVHNASFEKSKLKNLVERPSCLDLKPAVEALISRIIDTLEIVRDDGFYSPKMNGSFSLKDIVKAIPTSVDYSSSDSLTGGGDAQIVWFKCTNSNTPSSEKDELARRLENYCAADTYAMYDLIVYLENANDAKSISHY